jgi:hypothetical protein
MFELLIGFGTFFPFDPFSFKKKKTFTFLVLQNRTIGFEIKSL